MLKTTNVINTDRGSGIEEEIEVIMFDFYGVIFNCKKETELRQFDIFDFMFHAIAEIFSFY